MRYVLLITFVTFAGCDSVPKDAVKPYLAPADRYLPYRHWACPSGYRLRYATIANIKTLGSATEIVYCISAQAENEDQERWELDHTPEGDSK